MYFYKPIITKCVTIVVNFKLIFGFNFIFWLLFYFFSLPFISFSLSASSIPIFLQVQILFPTDSYIGFIGTFPGSGTGWEGKALHKKTRCLLTVDSFGAVQMFDLRPCRSKGSSWVLVVPHRRGEQQSVTTISCNRFSKRVIPSKLVADVA